MEKYKGIERSIITKFRKDISTLYENKGKGIISSNENIMSQKN